MAQGLSSRFFPAGGARPQRLWPEKRARAAAYLAAGREATPRNSLPGSLGRQLGFLGRRQRLGLGGPRAGRRKGVLRKRGAQRGLPFPPPPGLWLGKQWGCHGNGTLQAEPRAAAPVAMVTRSTSGPAESPGGSGQPQLPPRPLLPGSRGREARGLRLVPKLPSAAAESSTTVLKGTSPLGVEDARRGDKSHQGVEKSAGLHDSPYLKLRLSGLYLATPSALRAPLRVLCTPQLPLLLITIKGSMGPEQALKSGSQSQHTDSTNV
nr:uncharacterized protein LOC111769648 [Equus caballus]